MTQPKRIHPLAFKAQAQLANGQISRRDFMRYVTLLGTSVATASVLAACGGSNESQSNGADDSGPAARSATSATAGPQRGGTLRKAMLLQLLDHPARLSWPSASNIVRQVSEYLKETGADNITRPSLLENWQASDDVTRWTLNLRRGVTFNNGDEMTADDVMFSFSQWLDPEIGSSLLGLLSYLDGMNSVTKIDDYTIQLDLLTPNIGVPEHLFHYPAVILHREFEGDFVKQPIGSGAFLLEEYAEGERAVLKRREDYWRMGEDGQPLPYLDEIIYVSIAPDAAVAAVQAGQVDSLFRPRPSDWQALQGVPGLSIYPGRSSQCFLLRMRVDLEPWDDVRVRNALKMCQDRPKILQLAYFGEGELSIDAHVAPVHPAYCEKPIPEYDPDGARALLEEYAAEKGIQLPLRVTLVTKNDEAEPEIAQTVKELAAGAGFDITLEIIEPTSYWERWTDVDLGISSWTHRPLDTMTLPLAYIADAEGKPVPWNETRWVDEEFTQLLRQAEAELDVEARRAIMCQIEDIMQSRGPIGNPFWRNVWHIMSDKFHNISAHPTNYDLFYEVWKSS